MGKSRDTADGTRYVDASGDTMTGDLNISKGNTGADPYIALNIENSVTSAGIRLNSGSANGRTYEVQSQNTGEFIIYDRTADAYRMYVDPAGRVTKPSQPFFHAGLTTSVNITSSSQVIAFNDVRSNVGSHYNGSTYRFTAPVYGRYLFCVGVRWNYPPSSGYTRFTLRKNGSENANGLSIMDPINTFSEISYQNSSQTVVLDCAANDYFEVVEYSQNSGGQLASNECHFIGYLLG